MGEQTVGLQIEVPANASRFLATADEARRQLTGIVQLAWDDDDPWLFNAAFDPALVAHDESYYTSVSDLTGPRRVPTMDYLADRVLPLLPADPRVLDIGCGQGDFVEALRVQGIRARGYDPAARTPGEHLVPRYWTPEDESADVFVMRCVLPHIAEPWDFLDAIGRRHPDALVLVEFQRLEWILEHRIWYQISHDHVNLFRTEDFAARYRVVGEGQFAAGEWAWVLVRPADRTAAVPAPCPVDAEISALLDARAGFLAGIASAGRPLVLWGAAGKGIVLAHALRQAGADVRFAVDADAGRHGLHLEVSGLEVLPPERGVAATPEDGLVLVCNPNHLDAVSAFVAGRREVALPSALLPPLSRAE